MKPQSFLFKIAFKLSHLPESSIDINFLSWLTFKMHSLIAYKSQYFSGRISTFSYINLELSIGKKVIQFQNDYLFTLYLCLAVFSISINPAGTLGDDFFWANPWFPNWNPKFFMMFASRLRLYLKSSPFGITGTDCGRLLSIDMIPGWPMVLVEISTRILPSTFSLVAPCEQISTGGDLQRVLRALSNPNGF